MPLAYWLARAARPRHRYPHFECTAERAADRCATTDPELNHPAIGHVCRCDCRRCTLTVRGPDGRRIQVCMCTGCDALACGMHSAALPTRDTETSG